jgi:diamine N-acetyltransferase
LPQPTINIMGHRLALGPRRPDNLDFHLRWNNDLAAERTDNPADFVPITRESMVARWQEQAKSPSPQRILFSAYEVETWRPVGYVLLHGLDLPNRTSEMGIRIGDASDRGKGYGTEATRLLLHYAFSVLSLHSVFLTTLEYNLAGQTAYKRAGFREIGRQREASWMNGRYYDMIFMDILAEEFDRSLPEGWHIPGIPAGSTK